MKNKKISKQKLFNHLINNHKYTWARQYKDLLIAHMHRQRSKILIKLFTVLKINDAQTMLLNLLDTLDIHQISTLGNHYFLTSSKIENV